MFMITRDEAMALREKYGDDIGITITNRGKRGGRKKYYTEETHRVMYFLERFRNKQNRKSKNGRGVNRDTR